jgi:hypothetical protein
MRKKVLELFRPEIEAEVDRRIQEMVMELHRIDLPILKS